MLCLHVLSLAHVHNAIPELRVSDQESADERAKGPTNEQSSKRAATDKDGTMLPLLFSRLSAVYQPSTSIDWTTGPKGLLHTSLHFITYLGTMIECKLFFLCAGMWLRSGDCVSFKVQQQGCLGKGHTQMDRGDCSRLSQLFSHS